MAENKSVKPLPPVTAPKAAPSAKDNPSETIETAQDILHRVDFENEIRSAPTGEGELPKVTHEDTDGILYDPKLDISPKEDKEHGTFRRDFLFLPGPGGVVATDCAAAVVQEAIQYGYRPTGLAKVESTKLHADGEHVVVTWALPVSDQKRVEG